MLPRCDSCQTFVSFVGRVAVPISVSELPLLSWVRLSLHPTMTSYTAEATSD